jgi:hypothetical protein
VRSYLPPFRCGFFGSAGHSSSTSQPSNAPQRFPGECDVYVERFAAALDKSAALAGV